MRAKKINKKIFIKRILIIFIILIFIFIILKTINNSKNSAEYKVKLVINNEDVTDKLKEDIYISIDSTLYMSLEDVKQFLDNNLYLEDNTVITTCGTKVGAIDLDANTIILNSASLLLSKDVLKREDIILLPISELENLYNIDVYTTNESALVLSLYKSLSTINTTKKCSLKESESGFSKTIQNLSDGQELIYLKKSDKDGWIKVLTYEGNIGFIKENEAEEEKVLRVDMQDSDFSSKEVDINNSIEINSKTLTQDNLKDFNSRKKTVEDILSKILTQEKFTVNLNLENVEVSKDIVERLVIEMIPRLKEIGANLMITNNSILDDTFLENNNI